MADSGATVNFGNADTCFMLISASLVMLMTPGLALFYGGMSNKKSVLSMMMQSFISLCVTDLIWWAYGYTLAFGDDQGGVIGKPNKIFLANVGMMDPAAANPRLPEMVIFVYQLMFAIITPALITGTLGERIHFKAFLAFQIIWLTIVYVPWCHWIWGGGWLWQHGIRDFAGGIVVHCTAGFSGLSSMFFIDYIRGGRKAQSKEASVQAKQEHTPHNIPLFALGTALLWFGWYGFNAGSQMAVDQVTVLAFVNTDLAASAAAVSWLAADWIFTGKPKFTGLLTGSIAGLVLITPGAGYMRPWAAVITGIVGAWGCYGAIRFRQYMQWDDALDVWGCHGVGGYLGKWFLGAFSTAAVNVAGEDGLFYGDVGFFFKEIGAASFAAVYAMVVSFAIWWILNLFMEVVVPEAEIANFDRFEFSEVAYGAGGTTTHLNIPLMDDKKSGQPSGSGETNAASVEMLGKNL